MKKYDVVIIGSGLGGLQCGYILSKRGMSVCVLEKNGQAGGCMQTFRRGKYTFDTGFHYIGGLDEGQPLHRLFDYFGLMNLPWLRMDESGFDEVVINDKSYMFANGYERFVEILSAHFPHQQKNLRKYAAFLRNVSDHIFDSFEKREEEELYGTSLFAKSAYDYLTSTIDDPLLRNVLSGTSLKMELNPHTLPLYIFAQINSSYIQSAWRLRGGGSLITDSLINSIEANGGIVRMKAEVTRLMEEDGKIVAAEVNGIQGTRDLSEQPVDLSAQNSNAERIEADYFIANTHPAQTLSLITESKLIRNIYRKRIHSLGNTFGMFTVNIALKENEVPYLNRNIYIYKTGDVWQYYDYKPELVNTCALVSFQAPENGSSYTRNIDILTPMYWPEVRQWEGTTIGRRGDDYLSYKSQKAKSCINLASGYIPGLKDFAHPEDAIEKIYASTLLSYRDYTGTPNGSAYGIRKKYDQLMTTLLSPRTPAPNLFLTGQNLNLHGVLGVSMTSFFTCAEIVGMKAATEGLF
ncbi:MAG: NAD(P)/FAD-dependent oxidoreductase [Tannerella sp.]|nr:NAD(P)/FAD-dependent oxidoreductase [Tannerella sp.]